MVLGDSLYTRGVNKWSDLTQAEWEAAHLTGLQRLGASEVTTQYSGEVERSSSHNPPAGAQRQGGGQGGGWPAAGHRGLEDEECCHRGQGPGRLWLLLGASKRREQLFIHSCPSTKAFAATEQIESYTAISSGELVALSTQQMTSCTPNPLTCGGTGGCMGSTPPLGYNYVQLFGQIAEADYPYTSGNTFKIFT